MDNGSRIEGSDLFDVDGDDETSSQEEGVPTETRRNMAGFWLLGLFNNFAYVIMLSAAHDLLKDASSGDSAVVEATEMEESPLQEGRDCNPVSTGAILIADILPAIIIKAVAPFIHVSPQIKVIAVTVLSGGSFLVVSYSPSSLVTYIGVVCASLSSGLGEVTFLAHSHQFNPMVLSSWSSGTGGAGVFGAGSYAFLTAIGISPKTTVLLMICIPIGMILTFYLILEPTGQHSSNQDRLPLIPRQGQEMENCLNFNEKLRCIGGLVKYMLPLGAVYFFEYLINQGLFELLYFPNSGFTHSQQYRWYQLDYQFGVLLSRSSLHFIKIKNIKLLAVLQLINFLLFLLQSIYWTVPSISIVFVMIFWEGLLGGAAYVNTFYRISTESEPRKKEFSLGISSLADSLAIGIAGAVSIVLHHAICDLPVY